MHIFIDESGTFVPNGAGKVSVIGALIVPSKRLSEIERRWSSMRTTLPMDKGEVKGRLLGEADVAKVAKFLINHEALYEVDAYDPALGTDADVTAGKKAQADRMTANLTSEHAEPIWQWARDMESRVLAMPNQLFIQFKLLTHLIDRVLRNAELYYVQRRPDELGAFHWVIDAKSSTGVTTGEEWWRKTVMPFLQSMSFRNPFPILEGADYSHYKRFESEISEYYRPFLKNPDSPSATSMNLILTEDLRFSAAPEPGLELVDVITNAMRRAINGDLGRHGWLPIRGMMIHRKEQYIGLNTFAEDAAPATLPYLPLLRDFMAGGRNMIIDRHWREGKKGPKRR